MLKNIIKRSGIFRVRNPQNGIIDKLKNNFLHSERSFLYGLLKFTADCLYCHAAPGVLEETIIELSRLKPGMAWPKLLNLGGGTGQVPAIFRELGYDVFNLDIEIPPDQENDHNRRYDLNQEGPFPYDKNIFDIVLCQEIIEHIENPWKLFRQARELLKEDGLLVVSTPNILSSFSRWMFLFAGYFKWFTPECFTYHVNPLPDWEIRLIAARTGFELISVKGNGEYYFPGKIFSRKKNEELIYFFMLKQPK